MFKVTVTGENQLELELSGRLDSEAMKAALDELVEASRYMVHGRMLYRIGDFEWPTLGAMGVELSRLPALFGMIRRFDRIAVVAAKGWIRSASKLEGALIPGLEIRAFVPAEEDHARQWLAQRSD
ncbi:MULTISPECIES: STAS/SEC14 domain-containing protein [Oceanimonas]|uniref:STAS/SEC14 domain-containing protein n=1 Tax=Oceanimonas doudoroffii TaxID=84158 RepID=A0A233RGG3_9GAMM|nr:MULTISPECIES: STAS/SEC14 domain-containing protein [Oceanimonas]NHI02016.1 hypothetical protein [Oceanimonas sp. MB9]OXY82469.1 hypothetical protein B6S08_02765 [Oceanimonas doudoroffii]